MTAIHTRKIYVSTFVIAAGMLLFALALPAHAHASHGGADGARENVVRAGITPSSPLYFLDELFEQIREAIARSPEAKVRLQVAFAAERVAEISAEIEANGADAPGLAKAKVRLDEHTQKVRGVVEEEKQKGNDVGALANEAVRAFHEKRLAAKRAFEDALNQFKESKDALKAQIGEARAAGDDARVAELRAQLEALEDEKDRAENEKDAALGKLEGEKEELEDEMDEEDHLAQIARELNDLEAEKQEIIDEASEEAAEEAEGEDIAFEIPAGVFASFDSLLSQARNAVEAGNRQSADRLAEQADRALDRAEDAIERAVERAEEERERREEQREREEEKKEEAAEREQEKAEREAERAEEAREREEDRAENERGEESEEDEDEADEENNAAAQ